MTDAAESAADPPARKGAGPVAVLGLGLLCGVIGAGLGVLAPRYAAQHPAQHAPEPAAVAAPPPPTAAPAPPAPASAPPGADLTAVDGRIAAIEARQAHTAQAAASALAAAALVEATQGDRPFTAELAAVRAAAPDAPELAALAPFADVGAPTRAALAESFPDYAARAASAARSPGDGGSLAQKLAYVLSRIVTVRRVGETPGYGADVVLARAERLAEDGDLDGALRALAPLSPAAREAMAPWRARAERRAAIDRAAAALRARALRDLIGVSRSGA